MSIRAIRNQLRLSQSALAEASDVPLSALKRYERGLESAPHEALVRLAAVLGRPLDGIETEDVAQQGCTEIGEGYVTALNRDELLLARREVPESRRIRVLDLFCGTGGLSYGFEQTGKFAVTAGIDLLHDRVRSFHSNHPHATAIAADIRRYPTRTLGDHALNPDVIIGGPPCQGFSSIRPFRTLTESDSRN
jgi:DNA (cytosine-5)-methyltransferase 1